MMMQVEDGSVELDYIPGAKKATLVLDTGRHQTVEAVDLSPAELHQLAYHALQLANEIRSVPGRG